MVRWCKEEGKERYYWPGVVQKGQKRVGKDGSQDGCKEA